jgi:hypothetical protein
LVQVGKVLSSVFSKTQSQEVVDEFSNQKNIPFKWGMPLLLGFVFVGIGLGVTMGNVFFQSRYTEKTKQQILREYAEIYPQSQPALSPQDLRDFIENDEVITINGRALFPTFLQKGGGFQSVFAPAFDEQAFSRLAFYVMGSQGIGGSIPLDAPPELFPGFYLDVTLKGAMGITSMPWRSSSKPNLLPFLCAHPYPSI